MLTLLYGSTRTFIYDTRKFIALTIMTFVGKVKSLLFNMLPKFAPPQKNWKLSFQGARFLNLMTAVTVHSDVGAQEIKSVTTSGLLIYGTN